MAVKSTLRSASASATTGNADGPQPKKKLTLMLPRRDEEEYSCSSEGEDESGKKSGEGEERSATVSGDEEEERDEEEDGDEEDEGNRENENENEGIMTQEEGDGTAALAEDAREAEAPTALVEQLASQTTIQAPRQKKVHKKVLQPSYVLGTDTDTDDEGPYEQSTQSTTKATTKPPRPKKVHKKVLRPSYNSLSPSGTHPLPSRTSRSRRFCPPFTNSPLRVKDHPQTFHLPSSHPCTGCCLTQSDVPLPSIEAPADVDRLAAIKPVVKYLREMEYSAHVSTQFSVFTVEEFRHTDGQWADTLDLRTSHSMYYGTVENAEVAELFASSANEADNEWKEVRLSHPKLDDYPSPVRRFREWELWEGMKIMASYLLRKWARGVRRLYDARMVRVSVDGRDVRFWVREVEGDGVYGEGSNYDEDGFSDGDSEDENDGDDEDMSGDESSDAERDAEGGDKPDWDALWATEGRQKRKREESEQSEEDDDGFREISAGEWAEWENSTGGGQKRRRRQSKEDDDDVRRISANAAARAIKRRRVEERVYLNQAVNKIVVRYLM